MDTFLQIALSNAVAAGFLAVPAVAARCFWRRPALVHSLWLLVLLKLVTPPFVLIPVLPAPTVVTTAESPPLGPIDPAEAARILQSLPQVSQSPAEEPAAAPDESTEQTPTPPPGPLTWRTVVIAVWCAGSLLWLIVTVGRVVRFRLCLRQATAAPVEICQQVRGLADKLGLRHRPEVLLIAGPVSPMLFALGRRPRVLLPEALWSRLGHEERQTLLTHELAHYRRGDHWVRLIELLATGLYWWHPVVWWARHGLREAEEECCDAWVVSTLPAAARAYATALIETVDFLSETRPLYAPAASGIGHLHMLKRRLTMIMRGKTPRALSWTGLLTVLALGAILLPWLPTWAQDPPRTVDTTDTPAADGARKTDKPARTTPFHNRIYFVRENCTVCHVGNPHAGADAMALHDQLLRWISEVDRTRKQVQKAETALANARKRLQGNEKRLQDVLAQFRQATTTSPGKPLPPLKQLREGPRAPASDRQDQRLQKMQKQLDELRKEMEALRQHAANTPTPVPPPTQGDKPLEYRIIPAPGRAPLLIPNPNPGGPPLVLPDPKKNDRYYAPVVPLMRDKQG